MGVFAHTVPGLSEYYHALSPALWAKHFGSRVQSQIIESSNHSNICYEVMYISQCYLAYSMCCLFAALVNLAEEGFENLLLQSLRIVDGRNLRLKLANNLLLVLLVHRLEVQFAE